MLANQVGQRGHESIGHFTIWEYDNATLLSLESDP